MSATGSQSSWRSGNATALAFTIPGEPRGKGRPRATRFGKGVRLYTDAKTASYEGLIALAAQAALCGQAPLSGALRVTVTVWLAPPASSSKRARAAMLANEVRATKKPDLDNVVKAVLDGCNGVAFTDDALVTDLRALKRFAETPRVHVMIEPDAPAVAVAA